MPQRLVGRDGELARLRDWLADAATAFPRLILVDGEAGIGKTALAAATADAARAAGYDARWATCVEDAGVPPYWLWRQVADVDPAGDRFALFDQLLANLSRAPTLVVVDDVQWADEPSLLALRHMLRRPVEAPLFVCATRRSGEAARGWERVAADVLSGPDVEQLTLTGLAADAVGDLLVELAGRPMDDEVVRRAYADSGGNPLFVRELGRLLATGSSAGGTGVAELIAARVRRLGPAAQELLHAASILAEEWELPVAARLLERPTAVLLAPVDEAVAAGLLTASAPGRFRFGHALVRATLAAQVPLQERVMLHLRAAAALEDLHRDSLVTSYADIARHHAAVAVTGERRPAVEWSRRAADEAMRSIAYEEAIRLYALALECGASVLTQQEQAELLIARAAAEVQGGQLREAYDDCRRAVTLARAASAPDLLAAAALTLDAIGDRSWDRSIREWCREAVQSTTDDAMRARLLARLAEACVYSGMFDEGVGHAAAALEVADRSGDADALVAALRAQQLSLSGPDHTEERRELAARMTALGEQLGRPQVEMWGRLWAIDASWELGDVPAVAAETSRLRWCVEEVATPTARWHLLVAAAGLAQAHARFEEALAFAQQGLELMLAMGHPAALGAFMSLAAAVGHHQGHSELTTTAAPERVPEQLGEVRGELFPYIGPAFAMVDLGRLDEAEHLYLRPGPPATWDIPPYFERQALHAGAAVAAALGRTDDVEWFRDRLERCRGRHVAGGAGSASYFGPVELVLGSCALALGEVDRAVADLEEAQRICAAIGVPGFTVESSVQLAGALRRQGRSTPARELLRRVRPSAVELGMAPWVERIDRDLAVDNDPLTAREREVAGLVAQGKSNREIATTLVLSERTAANHVQHILTKLGFANRSQIAAWASTNE